MNMTQLKPTSVWKYFAEICKIPHISGNLEKINAYLMKEFTRLGYKPEIDAAGNIFVSKPATAGYKDRPAICLQAHSDMVANRHKDSKHDFTKDPIKAIIKDGWVTGNQTTLGADNGIGVAMILAVFADKKLKHGPINGLITSDEEIGLIGVSKFDVTKLRTTKYLVNLDSETDTDVVIGCSGGAYLRSSIPYRREPKKIPGTTNINLTLSGGYSGHSGVDIHLKRINAIKKMFYLLSFFEGQTEVRLVNVEKSGVAYNVIPPQCSVNICVNKKDIKNVKSVAAKYFEALKHEHHNEENLSLKISPSKNEFHPLVKADSDKIIGIFTILPNGVYSFSQKFGITETSSNLGLVDTEGKHIVAYIMTRSPYKHGLTVSNKRFVTMFKIFGGKTTVENTFSGWLPKNNHSKLADHYSNYYEKVIGKKPKQTLVAGGLECGVIADKAPHIECISFGPTMIDVHTDNERVNIKSTTKIFDVLVGFLKTLK